ncbi:MAG: carbohydrate ABC transporter permease [Spirochaetota bacterium]
MKWKLLVYVFLIIMAVFYVMPVYVLLSTGLKDFSEVKLKNMWSPPERINIDSFKLAWQGNKEEGYRGLKDNFLNSIYLVIPATVLSSFLGSMNGYVFSKWKFKGANVIFPLILFGMFIPYQSILIPLVLVLRRIGLYGSLPGLIFTHVVYGIPITSLIFLNYYQGIPKELVEAGKIDGANFLRIYRHLLFPLSMPGFTVVVIWQFTSIWNDFLFGLIVTPNPAVQPVTVALNNLAGSYIVQWNIQMAGALLVAIPPLLVYIFFGKFFLRGLLAGSLKG